MKLIHFSASDEALRQPFLDLEVIRLLQQAYPSLSKEDLANWALTAFSSDPDELTARYRIFQDLTDLSAVRDAYQKLLAYKDELDKQSRAMGLLQEVLYGERVLSAWLSLLESLQTLLDGAPESARLKSLSSLLAEIRQDPAYSGIKAAVTGVQETVPFPKHLYVALNARETGDATDIGIIRDDAEDVNTQALLDSTAPSMSSRSLFPDMAYTRAQYGTHFEEYLLQHYEKHYHSELTKAQKLLTGVRPLRSDELLELEDSLQYLTIGLSLRSLFAEKGFSLCLPDAHGAELAAADLLYPDLALSLPELAGKDVTLQAGSSTLITGANHSGKTSYLKTIGQSLVLAQFGFPVPAASYTFKPFQKYYTLFSTGEDSSMSVSRMGVEIQRLSVIMQAATADDLVLINEPMTSTNPIEAVSICCDLMERFIDGGITHLVVTHLYDIYYLLETRMTDAQKAHFISLITLSDYQEGTGMVHSYQLQESAPLGNSYALETAKSFQITLEDLMDDPEKLQQASGYCREADTKNIYGREA